MRRSAGAGKAVKPATDDGVLVTTDNLSHTRGFVLHEERDR